MTSQASTQQQRKARFWGRVRLLTLGLLVLWLAVTLAASWFARELAGWSILGFPASFWMASQGALLVYLAIVIGYALVMDRFDAAYLSDADQRREPGAPPKEGAP